MSDEFFTRADWRPGKKRRMQKRVKPWGGRKTAPAAFLEAARRTQWKPGRPGHRVCRATKRDGNPCGNLALDDMNVCGCHGGFGAWAKKGKLQKSGRSEVARAALRAAAVEDKTPPPHKDLINLQIYQQADQWTRMRLIRAFNSPELWLSLIRQLDQRASKTYVCD